jgi:hypothetical protein
LYKVTIVNDGYETVVHDPNVNKIKLASGIIKNEINLIDSFNLELHMDNPGFGKMRPFKTFIKVFNLKTGNYEFEGRILSPSESMENTGLVSASYLCEGELGYLHDSMQRHFEFRGTPIELLKKLLDYHNSQVETYKHFKVGYVTVTNATNNLYLYLSAEKNTFETIKEKLIDNLGGELQIRKVDGVRYLDYLVSVGIEQDTEIRIAKNLINMSRDVDPTEIVTRLTPLGARIKSSTTEVSAPRLTIESINNGVPYIDDKALIAEFGIQSRSVTWDDVTLPENLLSRGYKWLASQKTSRNQYKISALDLSLIGLDLHSFEIGCSYPLSNPIMGINERLRIVGKSLNINSPQDANLTVGDKYKTLNEYQTDANRSTRQVVDLKNTVNQLADRVNSVKYEPI